MDETYRMLGKEHEADLDREAERWRRAAEVRRQRRDAVPASTQRTRWTRSRFAPARLRAVLARAGRADWRSPVQQEDERGKLERAPAPNPRGVGSP